MPKTIEHYSLPASVHAIERGSGDLPMIVGRAAPFNSLSVPMYDRRIGKFNERILPGFFDQALSPVASVHAFWNHNKDAVRGSTLSGTLRLAQDRDGLNYEIDPPDTSWGRDAVTSVRRGDVRGTSFGFRNLRDRWKTENGQKVRELISGDTFDISPTAEPAYPDTSAALRSFLRSVRGRSSYANVARDETRRREEWLRDRQLWLASEQIENLLWQQENDFRDRLIRLAELTRV